ncbi:MAG TPA: sigma-70 family RNA polymerase sigma factor [Terriglobales bacterium]|nr:sigma-70 family RNA polymerase sigma factor [Terriglobales bacterium]
MDVPFPIRLPSLISPAEERPLPATAGVDDPCDPAASTGSSTIFFPPTLSEATAEPSSEILLARITAGDKEALSLLFRRYARMVRGVAYRILGDAAEADDMVQEVFLWVHRKCGSFDRSRSPVQFWILQRTCHCAISRRRYLASRHFYKQVDLEDVAHELAGPGASAGRGGNSIDEVLGNGALEKLFAALSEGQRQTLRLYFFEGYNFEEIAAKLNQTRGNVKHHYFRGLEKLRKQIFGSKP